MVARNSSGKMPVLELNRSKIFDEHKRDDEELKKTMNELNRLSVQVSSEFGFEEYKLKDLKRFSKIKHTPQHQESMINVRSEQSISSHESFQSIEVRSPEYVKEAP